MIKKQTKLDITFRYAILYGLLCRTKEKGQRTWQFYINEDPTPRNFRKFMGVLGRQTEPKKWMEKAWEAIEYDAVQQSDLDAIYNGKFDWLKRMRMTNSYHSRLNSNRSRQSIAFYPVEGFKTLQLLNLPGVFNMGDMVFRSSRKHEASLDWFINHPNRFMIDNGAFNTKLLETDFHKIIDWYRQLYFRSKQYNLLAQFQEQGPIYQNKLYEKVMVVAPDKPQNAQETLRLLIQFQDIIKQGTAQIDTMYAIQIAENNTRLVDKMLRIVSQMGPNSIIGIPAANSDLQGLTFSRVPYIVSKVEEYLQSSIPTSLYTQSMNQILEYTESRIQLESGHPGTTNPYRYHLLGASFGPTYKQILLNICICTMLVKECGIVSKNFNIDAIELFKKQDHRTKTILLGRFYHPEVYQHIVSADSSTWITASTFRNTIEPYAGTQYLMKKNSWLTHSVNTPFKRNLTVTSSKIAEANYKTVEPVDNRHFNSKPIEQVESSYSKYIRELQILETTDYETMREMRELFASRLVKMGNWKYKR